MDLFGYFMPKVEAGDMEQISVPLDFLGVNFYERKLVIEGDEQPIINVTTVRTDNLYTAFDWEVYPPGIYYNLLRIHRDYAPPKIYITESGACFDDELSEDGDSVMDVERTEYLRRYFEWAGKAIEDGVPLKGYFVWSLMDNFEWAEGYTKRFGVVYVDYRTQRRIIKDSGHFLASVAGRGGV
jgi:beta-glucosidase